MEIKTDSSMPTKLDCDIKEVADAVTGMQITDHNKKPTCLIILGMAGSGKTTFVKKITSHLYALKRPPYVVNLDPACSQVHFPANIDIRDSVRYKEVMKQYGIGPNGAIVTSLNLFATRFDQVMSFIEKKSSQCEYVIFDTPGQIEVFTWSASGMIITETLASAYPTIIVYVMDVVKSVSPVTFMSNMLYACSILYKTKLPFVIVMNKTDSVSHAFALEWIRDFTAFQDALEDETSYAGNLAQSLSLVLDEFYCDLNCVGVSSLHGIGIDEFFQAVEKATEEYEKDYKPEYERAKRKRDEEEKEKKQKMLKRLEKDVGEGSSIPLISTDSVVDPVYIKPGKEDDDDDEMSEENEMDKDELEENKPFDAKLLTLKQKKI